MWGWGDAKPKQEVQTIIDKPLEGIWYPVNLKDLPSEGRAYLTGVEIKFRPFNFLDLKRLAHLGEKSRFVYDLMLEGLDVKGMDVRDLTVPDLMMLLIFRNIFTSEHNNLQITTKCPICGKQEVYTIDVKNLDFEEMDPSVQFVKGIATIDGIQVHPLTMRVHLATLDHAFKSEEYDEIVNIAAHLPELYKPGLTDEQILELFNKGVEHIANLTSLDKIRKYQKAVNALYHAPGKQEVQCQNKDKGAATEGEKTTFKLDLFRLKSYNVVV